MDGFDIGDFTAANAHLHLADRDFKAFRLTVCRGAEESVDAGLAAQGFQGDEVAYLDGLGGFGVGFLEGGVVFVGAGVVGQDG